MAVQLPTTMAYLFPNKLDYYREAQAAIPAAPAPAEYLAFYEEVADALETELSAT